MPAPAKEATIAALAARREEVLRALATLRTHGWTNALVALGINVPAKTVRRWRAGTTTPRAIYADKLAALVRDEARCAARRALTDDGKKPAQAP